MNYSYLEKSRFEETSGKHIHILRVCVQCQTEDDLRCNKASHGFQE